MPLRDFIVLSIVLGAIPFCIFRPYVGVLMWAWVSYMNPHRLTWGIAFDFPVAMVIGGATLVGLIFYCLREPVRLPMERETAILLLLWALFTISTIDAINPEISWHYWRLVSKILLFTFVTIMLCVSRERLKYLLYVIVFSIGFYGVKGGLFTIMKGAQSRVWGPPNSFLHDANDIAMGLNMILPLLYFLSKEEQNRKLRYVLLGIFWLSILAVIGTYSRGGFLALCVILTLLYFGSNKKLMLATIGIVSFFVVYPMIPGKYIERIRSISAYEDDGSAQSRLISWEFSWRLALDHPLTGGGFEPMTSDTYRKYFPEYADTLQSARSAHSIYFQVLSDHGFITFGLFIALFISAIRSCRRLQEYARDLGSGTWIIHYSKMFELSMIGYLIAGLFYNRAYHDLIYHIIAAVIILKAIVRHEYLSFEKVSGDSASNYHHAQHGGIVRVN